MNRKSFLKTAALGALGISAAPTLAQPVPVPSALPRRSDVKITAVKAFRFRSAIYVKVETDAGVSGWGEADAANRRFAHEYLGVLVDDILIGADPFQSEGLWHRLFHNGLEAGEAGLHPGMLAGVDNALWDLKGRLLEMPVHKLLGGAEREKIRVYGSYGRFRGGRARTPQEMAQAAVDFVEQGYSAVKARMQIRQLNVDPDPDDTFEVVKAVREAIGDDIMLVIDFNNGYTAAKAIMMAKKLYEHFNIAILEEPVSQLDYRALAQVVDALDIPVMAGEHEYNKFMMRDLILQGNVDLVNADVIKCAGITECRKVAAIAQVFDKPIMVHNARPTLATAGSLQLVASLPNAARYQEYAGERRSLGLSELFHNYFEVQDGYITVPQTPGLGLEPNEEAMISQALDIEEVTG